MNGHDESTLELVVDEIRALTPEIKSFRLTLPKWTVLPPFEAGAHIRVRVFPEGGAQWRHYSLLDFDPGPAAPEGPRSYQIAVKREDGGNGGSRWMHEHVRPGDRLTIGPPVNTFGLDSDEEAVLIAGGIGITPIAAMATALSRAGRPFQLHYSARSRSHMPFVEELSEVADQRLHLYYDDVPEARLDLAAVLDRATAKASLYICGPKGMIDAAISVALQRGWPRSRIHVELFVRATPNANDTAFEVELRQSNRVLPVRTDQTILDALLAAGLDPLYDCKRGECGVCQTTVIEGDVDHRDYCLSEAERQSGHVMQICVSRARKGRLVLDM
ncbi:Phenoxybenzoate dioxygenase subunit beta [Paraburkholderia aspalathi]|uniref:PDR/VanB family oxidoreductase n=1 Tax=Paraburkholderia aspalathi TaxID=1324617 RepID=UPI00190BD506|nr:PDR/VanB family oxidoreductase [Paraburkholderia aspalathi]MBK3843560.1 oxidoreductase [Paraburkholderia aspalathi]CAE6855617.1 Phenoxybenzoate dioxygenase subunit beta [Paraburkholderia aspalathi]